MTTALAAIAAKGDPTRGDEAFLSDADLLSYFETNGIIDNGSIQEAILAKKKMLF